MMPRRRWLAAVLGSLPALAIGPNRSLLAAPLELKLPADAPVRTIDSPTAPDSSHAA